MLGTGKDDIFGEDVKKSYFDETRQAGKSLYTVSTISYCDLHKITIDDLQTIMDAYPEFAGDFLLNFGVTFNLREVCTVVISTRRLLINMCAIITNELHSPVHSNNGQLPVKD